MKPSSISQPISILGLMTGSSADGLDICIASFWEQDGITSFKIQHSERFDYPLIFKTAFQDPLKLPENEIKELDIKLGKWLAKAVSNIEPTFDFIASHGQTIKHEPPFFSLQIGDPVFMAKATHKPVIYDFRSADIQAGGQGAPLIPITDVLLLQQAEEDILSLNVGGISNLTIVPSAKSRRNVLAWDCGPGNTLIDKAVRAYTLGQMDYDKDGDLASTGKLDEGLLKFLLDHEFYSLRPPKSAGQEQFGHEYFNELLKHTTNPAHSSDLNLIHTVTLLTAKCIADSIHTVENSNIPRTMHIAGGGWKNKTLMSMLRSQLPHINIQALDMSGVTPDNKEAFGFAYLGYLHLLEKAGNIPSVTGARTPVKLGRICQPD